jgi:hypothetical protein
MTSAFNTLLAAALGAALAASVLAPSALAAEAAVARTPFLPVANEAPAKLTVGQPIPERLAAGAVLIPYQTENFRILPVFGASANDVSPRAGHLHVTLDDLPWHWADAGANNTIVVVGLPPGPHKILVELAMPDHGVIAGEAVNFVVPDSAAAHSHH